MQRNLIFYLLLLLLVIIFAVQNFQAATIKFYFWTVSVSTGLLITIVFIAGVLLGLLTASYANRRKHRREAEKKKEAEQTVAAT